MSSWQAVGSTDSTRKAQQNSVLAKAIWSEYTKKIKMLLTKHTKNKS